MWTPFFDPIFFETLLAMSIIILTIHNKILKFHRKHVPRSAKSTVFAKILLFGTKNIVLHPLWSLTFSTTLSSKLNKFSYSIVREHAMRDKKTFYYAVLKTSWPSWLRRANFTVHKRADLPPLRLLRNTFTESRTKDAWSGAK